MLKSQYYGNVQIDLLNSFFRLKKNKSNALLLSRLLDTWVQLQDSDQAFLLEAIEQLMVNVDLTAASLKALQDAVEKLKTVTEFSRIHAMLLVENKFLSLYSRWRNSSDYFYFYEFGLLFYIFSLVYTFFSTAIDSEVL